MHVKNAKNKLQIGDKVQVKVKCRDWHSIRLDIYMVPVSYRFSKSDFPEIHFWLTHSLKNTLPVGKVIRYGAQEDDSTRLNVLVRFSHLGHKVDVMFRESQLKKVKK